MLEKKLKKDSKWWVAALYYYYYWSSILSEHPQTPLTCLRPGTWELWLKDDGGAAAAVWLKLMYGEANLSE